MSKVAEFEIHASSYLGPDGALHRPLPEGWADVTKLQRLYRAMMLTRAFDAKAVQLQRTGRLGTYASCLGQEAVGVGIGAAMAETDVLVPSFREQGAQLFRGVSLTELFQYWGGDERGSNFAGPRQDFPISITVGGHAPHAGGVALAMKLRGEARATVCVIGDGATSKGDVYEAMNAAGVWLLPLVFVVCNNQWAISTPRSDQTAAETLAQKAIAAGFDGEQVDGNDVVAVASTIQAALERARDGYGPHVVECLTYRLADHTTVDDASRYRDDAEVARWWRQDPLARLRTHLANVANLTKEDEERYLKKCADEVDAAADVYLNMPAQAPGDLFDYLYADLPPDLAAARAAVAE